jgi:hypothetical protein
MLFRQKPTCSLETHMGAAWPPVRPQLIGRLILSFLVLIDWSPLWKLILMVDTPLSKSLDPPLGSFSCQRLSWYKVSVFKLITRKALGFRDFFSAKCRALIKRSNNYVFHQKIKSKKATPKISNSNVKDQRVKVMISNERSCQKEYTCELKSASTNQSKVISKVKAVRSDCKQFFFRPEKT